jgi:hypothetical protein
LPASRNEDIMLGNKFAMARQMRMILHPLFRTFAVLAAIVSAWASFGATVAHANGAPHHGPIQTIGNGPVTVAAMPMAMHDDLEKPCCPANSGQTEGSGCPAAACSSLPGALTTTFVAEGSPRPMRDCFFIPQDKLSPHNLRPEHGPPRI